MSRRSLFIYRIPWWCSLFAAIVSYSTLSYLLPNVKTTDPGLAQLLATAPAIAPVVTIFLLLISAAQLYEIPARDDKDPGQNDHDTQD